MSKLRPEKLTVGYILRENALQIIMYILGAIITGLIWWPLAIIYLAIAVATNIFYMYWVCPYCGHYALGTCAAGFDWLSGKHFKAKLNRTFRGQFSLGTVVVGIGWFLPPIAAVSLIIVHFSWLVLTLLTAFSVIGFWLLPESSKKHCDGCETVDCPRRPKKMQAKV
jgi:hypothetical protein